MIVQDMIEILGNNVDCAIQILLPSQVSIPEHFHVTEVGRVEKKFIDCGGTLRTTTNCSLQIWTADDIEHRLNSTKLLKIIQLAKSLDINDLNVEVEYGKDTVSIFSLKDITIGNNLLLLELSNKQTDCLAPDKCGVNVLNNCCNSSGCC